MAIRDLAGAVMCLWLLSIVACIISFRWALYSLPRRLWPGVLLSAFALIGGFLGIHFRVIASRTVNSHVQWKFDSKYFFVATVVLAALTLAFTVWRQRKLRSSA
jgi:hypothetical protein